MNDENLIPFNRRTESEARELSRKGGVASGKSRNYFKKFRELMENHLDEEIDTKQGTMSKADVMIQNIIKKAAKGDVRAFQLVVDVIKYGAPKDTSADEDNDNADRIEGFDVHFLRDLEQKKGDGNEG